MTKVALIIVNKEFHVQETDDKRCGATKDFQKMCWMFAELGFIVIHRFNQTSKGIRTAIKDACSIPSECFVLVLSTHGEESYLPKDSNTHGGETGLRAKVYDQMVLGIDGQALSVNNLLKEIDNNALKNMPKICFIQACRSIEGNQTIAIDEGTSVFVQEQFDKTDGGILHFNIQNKVIWYDDDVVQAVNAETEGKKVHQTVNDGEETYAFGNLCVQQSPFDLPDSDNEDGEVTPDVRGAADSKTMPKEATLVAPVDCPTNFLVMYPVQPHKYALRKADTGSLMLYYMFKLRNMLKNDGRILSYLTTVLRAMADHTSHYKGQEIKMCGTIYHRLTREVFLKNTHAPTKQFETWKSMLKSKRK
ncbi:uncharacterized protein LOC127876163 [Dreissena polymorpha]|uniref:uncharacterized protein LOC127876163 n=1 Tax=Dreissena polymorpha TaxID=45954 RepID=UPI002263CE8A|nr:uncharacterized protein LOC127876163 [Dreissena polymorpha]XP_052277120.1 uncharacterized protein LOC127876163 [Dreissena polymorpha]XP_052277121.1 uncharacterized protein LOC127876163 [Dreissena polymorpha]XP_052277122.1 uncharacterized protein LOC127876163 [Dreissena polymorpha]